LTGGGGGGGGPNWTFSSSQQIYGAGWKEIAAKAAQSGVTKSMINVARRQAIKDAWKMGSQLARKTGEG
jgi:hypothetical protein